MHNKQNNHVSQVTSVICTLHAIHFAAAWVRQILHQYFFSFPLFVKVYGRQS